MLSDEDLSVLLDRTFKSATRHVTVPADLTGSLARRLKTRRRMKTTGVTGLAVAAACVAVISAQLPGSTSHDGGPGNASPHAKSYRLAGFDSAKAHRAAARADLSCMTGSFHGEGEGSATWIVYRGHEVVHIEAWIQRASDEQSPGDGDACLQAAGTTVKALPMRAKPVPGHPGLYLDAAGGAVRSGYFSAKFPDPSGGHFLYVKVLTAATVSDRDFIDLLALLQHDVRLVPIERVPITNQPSR
jgi:hypothetical protein